MVDHTQSRCIICLTSHGCESEAGAHKPDSNDYTRIMIDQVPETPLMSIRQLCGECLGLELCKCQYNIHVSCFVKTNKVFENVCPVCRKYWWYAEHDGTTDEQTTSNEQTHRRLTDLIGCFGVIFCPISILLTS